MEEVQGFGRQIVSEGIRMNRTEYLDELGKNLRRLPDKDREDAIMYYTEYFEDAGPEREQEIMNELGSPKELAKKIIIDCVGKEYAEEQVPTQPAQPIQDGAQGAQGAQGAAQADAQPKKKTSFWVIILAILALPMSPVVLALLIVLWAVVFALLVSLFALVFSFFVVGVTGIFTTVVSIPVLFINPAIGLMMMGTGLVIMAVGGIAFVGVWALTKLFIELVKTLGRKFVHKKAGNK